MSGRLTRLAVRTLDGVARLVLRPPSGEAAHMATGRRGEEEAYFYLRQHGYVMVAQNFRSPRRKGEIDLIGWDGDVLCFIEVKTRSTRAVAPAEAAVDVEKQQELIAMAHEYLRRVEGQPGCRFDIASIYLEEGRPVDITLFKNAFPMA
ncbi:MAG TPA: YraN family protein [Terriglobales bacterium]|nr:YraN family protein [Terriglobales bacterium]